MLKYANQKLCLEFIFFAPPTSEQSKMRRSNKIERVLPLLRRQTPAETKAFRVKQKSSPWKIEQQQHMLVNTNRKASKSVVELSRFVQKYLEVSISFSVQCLRRQEARKVSLFHLSLSATKVSSKFARIQSSVNQQTCTNAIREGEIKFSSAKKFKLKIYWKIHC